MQIRSHDLERRQERREREEERLRREGKEAEEARADIIEGIVSAIAEYSDPVSRRLGTGDHRIRVELAKLTTRAGAEHLSHHYLGYILDSHQSPHEETLLETLNDIQGRLEGWHIGHLTLCEVNGHIADGRTQVREFLRRHGITPATYFEHDGLPAA
ncbi:hypothetical protein [Marisediminicola senii]|uniref:hypothetical protein n=1 Tax=Marisediminicola senii TaxID=2711233 RepID=UPI0013ECC8FB|nr:hypothetical protein [Marisediminicola senii]